MNRRDLLGLAAILAGYQIPAAAESAHINAIDRIFPAQSALRLVGRKCLEILPANREALSRLAGFDQTLSKQEMLTAFVAKRSDDFLTGRIHIVEGWVMAESECAVCAMAELG